MKQAVVKSFAALILTAILTGQAQGRDAECAVCEETAQAVRGFDVFVAPTAEILEPDWEELLRSRVSQAARLGLFRAEQMKTQNALARHARRPVEIALAEAKEARVRRLVILDEETVAGMNASVREVLSGFKRGYVFFNADSAEQRAFVQSLPGIGSNVRPVATAGDLAEASRLMRMRLFADQGASLVRRFDIEVVPSVVRLVFDGKTVSALVEEVPVSPDDDESIKDAAHASQRLPNTAGRQFPNHF